MAKVIRDEGAYFPDDLNKQKTLRKELSRFGIDDAEMNYNDVIKKYNKTIAEAVQMNGSERFARVGEWMARAGIPVNPFMGDERVYSMKIDANFRDFFIGSMTGDPPAIAASRAKRRKIISLEPFKGAKYTFQKKDIDADNFKSKILNLMENGFFVDEERAYINFIRSSPLLTKYAQKMELPADPKFDFRSLAQSHNFVPSPEDLDEIKKDFGKLHQVEIEPIARGSMADTYLIRSQEHTFVLKKQRYPDKKSLESMLRSELTLLKGNGLDYTMRTSLGARDEQAVLDKIAAENDFGREKNNIEVMKNYYHKFAGIRVAGVAEVKIPDGLEGKYLAMELVPDATTLNKNLVSYPDEVKDLAFRYYYSAVHQPDIDGIDPGKVPFHGDFHGGNIMRGSDGLLTAIDFGKIGYLEGDEREFFRNLEEYRRLTSNYLHSKVSLEEYSKFKNTKRKEALDLVLDSFEKVALRHSPDLPTQDPNYKANIRNNISLYFNEKYFAVGEGATEVKWVRNIRQTFRLYGIQGKDINLFLANLEMLSDSFKDTPDWKPFDENKNRALLADKKLKIPDYVTQGFPTKARQKLVQNSAPASIDHVKSGTPRMSPTSGGNKSALVTEPSPVEKTSLMSEQSPGREKSTPVPEAEDTVNNKSSHFGKLTAAIAVLAGATTAVTLLVKDTDSQENKTNSTAGEGGMKLVSASSGSCLYSLSEVGLGLLCVATTDSTVHSFSRENCENLSFAHWQEESCHPEKAVGNCSIQISGESMLLYYYGQEITGLCSRLQGWFSGE